MPLRQELALRVGRMQARARNGAGVPPAVSDHMVPLSTFSKLGGANVIKSVLDGSPMSTLKTVKFNYVMKISL